MTNEIKTTEQEACAEAGGQVERVVSAATHVAHCVTGPVYTCEKHALQIGAIANVLGARAVITAAEPGHECANCKYGGKYGC